MTIVKVQRPLMSSKGSEDFALIYDQDCKHLVQQTLDKATRKAMAGDLTAFFNATFIDGNWVIGQRVEKKMW